VYILAFPFVFYSIFLIYKLRRRRNVLPKIIIKRSTILYLFIDYLTNLIHSRLIINRKGPNEVLKGVFPRILELLSYIYIFILLFFFYCTNFGPYSGCVAGKSGAPAEVLTIVNFLTDELAPTGNPHIAVAVGIDTVTCGMVFPPDLAFSSATISILSSAYWVGESGSGNRSWLGDRHEISRHRVRTDGMFLSVI
jgi:hypothetical protein